MFFENSDLPDLTGLSDFEIKIFEFVLEQWPTSSIEIAENFGENISTREQKKRLSAKYSYYLKKLVLKKLILSKKSGNSIIVWPIVVEKYRVIHNILKYDDLHYFELSRRLSKEANNA